MGLSVNARIDTFEALFDDVSTEKPEHGGVWTVVWSGALSDDPRSHPPALFDRQELAWEHWSRTAAELYAALKPKPDEKYRLYWQQEPVIWKYQITMMDVGNRQRLVSDRYAVYSVLCIGTIGSEADTANEAAPPKPPD